MALLTKMSYDDPSLEPQPMQAAHLPGALRLSQLAGWNQRLEDWQLLRALNPQGAFVICDRERVAGTVTAVQYSGRVSWIGMVLVDPDYRGRGLASRLMQAAIKSVTGLATIQLDATPDGEPVYRRIGFTDTFKLCRMTGVPKHAGQPAGTAGGLRPMREADLPVVAGWDALVIGANRLELLAGLLRMAPEYAWVVEGRDSLDGFVMGRHGLQFEHIGPFMARTIKAGTHLLEAVLTQTGECPIVMDIADQAVEWRQHVEALGLEVQRPFTRMFLGTSPIAPPYGEMLAIAGPELG